VVPYCRALETRKRHGAVTSEVPAPANVRDFASALQKVAEAVRTYTNDD